MEVTFVTKLIFSNKFFLVKFQSNRIFDFQPIFLTEGTKYPKGKITGSMYKRKLWSKQGRNYGGATGGKSKKKQ